jgi:hypothetical protein
MTILFIILKAVFLYQVRRKLTSRHKIKNEIKKFKNRFIALISFHYKVHSLQKIIHADTKKQSRKYGTANFIVGN